MWSGFELQSRLAKVKSCPGHNLSKPSPLSPRGETAWIPSHAQSNNTRSKNIAILMDPRFADNANSQCCKHKAGKHEKMYRLRRAVVQSRARVALVIEDVARGDSPSTMQQFGAFGFRSNFLGMKSDIQRVLACFGARHLSTHMLSLRD